GVRGRGGGRGGWGMRRARAGVDPGGGKLTRGGAGGLEYPCPAATSGAVTTTAAPAPSSVMKSRRFNRSNGIRSLPARAASLGYPNWRGSGRRETERFYKRAVVPMSAGGHAESRIDFRRRCPRRSIMLVARRDRAFDSKARTGVRHGRRSPNSSLRSSIGVDDPRATDDEEAIPMSKEADNKAVVGRWFTEFWGKKLNFPAIDYIA